MEGASLSFKLFPWSSFSSPQKSNMVYSVLFRRSADIALGKAELIGIWLESMVFGWYKLHCSMKNTVLLVLLDVQVLKP